MTEINWDALSVDEVPNFAPKIEFESPEVEADKGRRAKTKAPKSPKPIPPKAKGKYVQPLTEIYGFVGMGLILVDPVCGQAVLSSAEACAKSVDELAYKNPAVRRVVESITQGSAVGAVVAAHMPIILAVAGHHGGKLFGAMLPTSVTVDEDVTIQSS